MKKTDTFKLNRKQRHLLIDAICDSIKAEESELRDMEYDLENHIKTNVKEVEWRGSSYTISSFKSMITRFKNDLAKDEELLASIKE